MGGGAGNFDEEYWRKGTIHEPNNLKLKKQAMTNTSNQR